VSGLVLLLGAFAQPFSKAPTVPLSLQDDGGLASDLLRTYCPGPSGGDVFGTQPFGPPSALAQASVSRHQLQVRQTNISLSSAGSFSGLGYAGTRGGAVRLDLTLLGVTAGTRVETR
jgi:hypothetical protein